MDEAVSSEATEPTESNAVKQQRIRPWLAASTWKPGQSGNPAGRKPRRTVEMVLKEIVDPVACAELMWKEAQLPGRIGFENRVYMLNRMYGAPKQMVSFETDEADIRLEAARLMYEHLLALAVARGELPPATVDAVVRELPMAGSDQQPADPPPTA